MIFRHAKIRGHVRVDGKADGGYALIMLLVMIASATALIVGFADWTMMHVRAARAAMHREQALMIAEAGLEYYRWHLAHSPTDFQDGTGGAGPYVHQYRDKDGTVIGDFTLTVTAPSVGSTVVTIKSTGTALAAPNIQRSLQVTLAKPSWARFAVLANDFMRFGEGTTVYGPIHSNEGIRFDGLAHNLVTSASTSFNDPDHSGNSEFGVHTHVRVPPQSGVNDDFISAEAPNSAVAARSDVFLAGRQFPVPEIDFDGISADFSQLKADAQSNGRYFPPSGNLGYHVILRTNDTFDIYRVTSLTAAPNGCGNNNGQNNWGTWSINAQTFIGNYANPANGIIFTEDHVWVDGQINTARITVAAARFPQAPGQWRDIIVNSDLRYTNYDGTDVIALMAQGNFAVGWASEADLRIDAAVVAQNGRVGRYFYEKPGGGQNNCSPNDVKDVIELYGMIASNDRYGFAYTDGSGYETRILNYDANLLYSPPPSFPLTTDEYVTLDWREVQP